MSIEKKLDAKSTLLTFIPTTAIGAVAMGYAQYVTHAETESTVASIAAGLAAQTIARSLAILPSHAIMNKTRLKKESGKYCVGTYAQEMISIATSAKILYTPWFTALTTLDAYLVSQEYNHFAAGSISSTMTGAAYAITLAFGSPKINAGIDWFKKRIKSKSPAE